MKTNWRVILASVVIVGMVFWAIDSARSRSYAGVNLNFDVGSGSVTVINASDAPAPAQLIGSGTRSFSVTSSTQGLSGISNREGTGRSAMQVFAFNSPPGTSVFSVVRGSEVKFVGSGDTALQANVQPLTDTDMRATLIVAGLIILGSLYYISRETGHRWIGRLRGKRTVDSSSPESLVVSRPTTSTAGDPNRGRDGRMYSNYGNKD